MFIMLTQFGEIIKMIGFFLWLLIIGVFVLAVKLPKTWRGKFGAVLMLLGLLLAFPGRWAYEDKLADDASPAILDGGAGNDIVWAGAQKESFQHAIAEGETQPPSGRNNVLLNGHTGDDTLIGDAGHDVLFGGESDDTLLGGSGNGIILADGEGIGLNTGGASPEFAWSRSAGAEQIPALNLRLGVAMTETAQADSSGRKLRSIYNIDMSGTPLADTDLSGLLAMPRYAA